VQKDCAGEFLNVHLKEKIGDFLGEIFGRLAHLFWKISCFFGFNALLDHFGVIKWHLEPKNSTKTLKGLPLYIILSKKSPVFINIFGIFQATGLVLGSKWWEQSKFFFKNSKINGTLMLDLSGLNCFKMAKIRAFLRVWWNFLTKKIRHF